jgi:hypothetical protein
MAMYDLPPAVLFNERTGRLELQHAVIARRVLRVRRLRARYRARVLRRSFRLVVAWLRRGLSALGRVIRARLETPGPIKRFN